MRFLLTFFALFTPLAWALWALAGDVVDAPALETAAPEFGSEPVLDTSEIPQLPVRGEIQRLEKGLFQRFHAEQNYVVYYVSFQDIERVNGKTRIVGISCAVFGEPEEGRENIRARMEAPYLEGDPVALIAKQTKGARELVLGGGVKVYDGLGRLMAELESLTIDLDSDSLSTDGEVLFRDPKKKARVSGRGMLSDLAFTNAKLLADIRARLPYGADGEEAVTLACAGPATVERDEKQKTTVVTLRNAARIEHDDVAGACDTITAHLKDKGASGEVDVEKVVLEGAVHFELDPLFLDGLEEFHAHRITITGRDRILIEGNEEPVRAVRRGPLEAFGLADRVLDFEAPKIDIRLLPGAEHAKDALESVRFPEGLRIRDREGPGTLRAGWLHYDAQSGQLEAKKDLVAGVVGRRLEADRIEVRRPPDREDTVVVGVFGKKSLRLRATGKLGPLVRGKENSYTFSCDGPLYVESRGKTLAVRASKQVRVLGTAAPVVECEQVFAVILDKALRLVDAEGAIRARDPETGAKLRAERLNFTADKEQEIYLRGSPAVIEHADGVVEAGTLRYRDDGDFVAGGGIRSEVSIDGQRWEFRADSAEGAAPDVKGPPKRFLARGGVTAKGPKGATLHADSIRYLDETGRITLVGAPARIRQGGELSYEGERLVVDIENRDKRFLLVAAKSAGPTRLVVTPGKNKGSGARVARWEVELSGDVWLEKGVVRSVEPTRLKGYDEKGGLLVDATAAQLRVEVEQTKKGLAPKKLTCSEGVELETFKRNKREWRLEARSLTYVVNARTLDLQGPGKAWGGEQKEPTLFREAEFELLDDGVNLKYLGKLRVSGR